MKLILLLAILFIASAAVAKEKNNRRQSVTYTLSKPTHIWIINIDKVSKQTKNISMLQPVIAVIRALSPSQTVELRKEKFTYL